MWDSEEWYLGCHLMVGEDKGGGGVPPHGFVLISNHNPHRGGGGFQHWATKRGMRQPGDCAGSEEDGGKGLSPRDA